MINNLYTPIMGSSHLVLAFSYLISLYRDRFLLYDIKKYPFKKISILIACVYIIIALQSYWMPFVYSIYIAIGEYLLSFFMLFVGYHAVKTPSDYDKIIRLLKPIVLVSSIYGLICFVLQDNPYNDIIGISDIGSNYNAKEALRGYRISAFSSTSNPHALLLIVCSFLIINYEQTKYSYILLILSLFNIVLSASRAPLFDLAILILTYFLLSNNLKKKLKVIFLSVIILFILFQIPFFEFYISKAINSSLDIFKEVDEQEIGGSSIECRIMQFESGWNYLIEKPWFGHGFRYYSDIIFEPDSINNGLLGMESYLLMLFVEQGSIMIILSFTFYFSLFHFILKKRNNPYYRIPLALSIMFMAHLLMNRPTDFYEYVLPFIGISIKMLSMQQINENSYRLKQMNVWFK